MKREMNAQAATIFRNAAQYIRTYGWQVSGMSKDGLPRCSMGALQSAYSVKRWDPRLAKLMYDTLYNTLDGLTLTEFNHLHKNGEAVAQLFEQAAGMLIEKSTTVLV